MANFTDKRINQTYQRLVQVDGSRELQDGLGRKLSGSMGDLEITGTLAVTGSLNIPGFPDVSSSLASLHYFSSSLDATYATDAELATVSSSLAAETAQLLDFSASLDATYATDSQLENVSSSLALETAQLLQFSASLDATFATDAQLEAGVGPLTAATSSYALKAAISGAFDITSASLASRIAGLDANYATDSQLNDLSSSVSNAYLSDVEWLFHSSSIKNDISYDSARIGFLENKTLVSGALQVTSSLDNFYARKTEITGSFSITSSSLANRIDAISSSLDTYQVTGSSTMPQSNAYLIPNIIRGGENTTTAVTSSGVIFKLEYTSSVNGTHTVELPDASTPENTYRKLRFISDDSVSANDTFTISGSNGQLIEGSATYIVDRSYEGVMLWSDGSSWFRIQSKA